MNELNDWTKMQVRSAILLGHDVYALRTAALLAVGGDANKLSQREADSLALECAAYAEAALLRLESVQENGGYLVVIEAFLAAEHAAGHVAAIGYWNAQKKWVSRTAVQFVKDLKAAYAQRAAIRRAR